ncbi:winged helix DNA-binding protein [Nitrosopumilus sp.]|uniref:winged helix DNA-binding protein n=1 Tax=Nitrosopumilus sp. TaxID=2024843 RepID=UPI0026303E16|nr:winged helix DNA-binding protein [Nitrosopumilus sp.]
MLVEIPDPEVILGVIVAFLVGLGGLYGYYKIKPFIKSRSEMTDASQSERLEYYERQLIDMKIRLDALEIQGIEQKTEDPNIELKQFLEKLASNQVQEQPVEQVIEVPEVEEKPVSTPKTSHVEFANPTDYVLHLITNKAMTSRDIQITLKRSREHTSRLMKKLFEDGYVQRNTNSKPYTYSITEKGKAKVDDVQSEPQIA